MADLSTAESRLEAALERLESIVAKVAERRQAAGSATVIEYEQLLEERDRLKSRLQALDAHHTRLRALAGEVEGELGEAISRLDDLARS
jgi:hypothetical protein